MPPSMERPWSTQYKEDYNKRTKKEYKRPPVPKRPTTAYRKRTPSATKISISAFNGIRTSGDEYYRQEANGDQQPLLEERGSKFKPAQERPNTPQNINVIGQATKTVHPEQEAVIPEPIQLRTNTPPPKNLHWSCWPEPVPKEKKRPNTSLGFYRSVRAEIDDRVDGKSNALVGNPGPPGVNNPEFYEEKVLNQYQVPSKEDRMMSMKRANTFCYEPPQNGRMTSISVNEPPPRDTYTMYNNQPRRSHSVSPTGHYNQSFFPYHKPGGAGVREELLMNNFAKAMEGKEPLPNNYQYSFHKYPFSSRLPKRAALGEEYVHQHSMFMLTTPRCTGHFIIHPDWVSEKGGIRRSKSFMQSPKKNQYGFKY